MKIELIGSDWGLKEFPMNNQRFYKFKFIVIISVPFLFSCKIPCFAGDSINKGDVQNAFPAGLAGTVMGAVVIAFNRKSDDYTNYLDMSSHGRVAVGGANGSLHRNSNLSIVQIENGKVSFGIPAIIPDFQDRTVRGTPVVITAEIIRGDF
jgi:hypothetical protein